MFEHEGPAPHRRLTQISLKILFAAAGFTPSEAVRALWQLAVKQRRNAEALRSTLVEPAESQSPQAYETPSATPEDPQLAAYHERRRRIDKQIEALGIDTSRIVDDGEHDDEILADLLYARYFGGESDE